MCDKVVEIHRIIKNNWEKNEIKCDEFHEIDGLCDPRVSKDKALVIMIFLCFRCKIKWKEKIME